MGFISAFNFGFNNYAYTPSFVPNFGGFNSYTPLFSFGKPDYSSYSYASTSNSYDFSFLNSAINSPKVSTRSSVLLGSLTPSNRSGRSKYFGIGSEYGNLGMNAALQKARSDSRLEFIGNGGNVWSISSGSFINDIKYATRGTSQVLDDVVSEVRKSDPNFSLLVTSALGTASSPHSKRAGHYDVNSVKLDFGGGMSKSQATKVASQLRATGKFDFANLECDGSTWHIDAQIKKEFLA